MSKITDKLLMKKMEQ